MIISINSCSYNRNHELIEIGRQITLEQFKRLEQVHVGDQYIIIVINSSQEPLVYDPFIYFLDHSGKCVSSCYFSFDRIEELTQNKILGYYNYHRASRRKSFPCKIPEKYVLDSIPTPQLFGGYQNKTDKIIKGLELVQKDSVRINYYPAPVNFYYHGQEDFPRTSKDSLDTLTIPLVSICFNNVKNGITCSESGSDDRIYLNAMPFDIKGQTELFLTDLYYILFPLDK